MYNAIEAGMLSANGINTWMPVATAANVAQGAACLAVAVKSKNAKTKSVALPAALSAYLGITEPAIFGVNVRYMKPFVAGCIGGAAGALIAGITGVGATAYGITGIFGFLITTNYVVQYAMIIIVATVVAFVISWILFKEEKPAEKTVEENKEVNKEVQEAAVEAEKTKEETANVAEVTIVSPLKGKVVPLAEVNDPMFAGEVLGKGAAVLPEEGRVIAPFDGKVTALFPTNHAVGLTGKDGVEVLIHIGINTVELEGKHYHALVAQDDEVKAGQPLVEFDMDAIKAAGYDVVTPVVVTNADQFEEIQTVADGSVNPMDALLQVK